MSRDREWLADLVILDDPVALPVRGSRTSRPEPSERQCPNCDASFTPDHPLRRYCTDLCRQTAKVIRYARAALAQHGDPLPADIHEAIGIRIAHVIAGGYHERARRLPPAIRAAVNTRDHDRCVLCGQPGEEIDHTNGDSNDLDNLRLLCRRCHRRVTAEHLRRIPDGHPALAVRDTLLRRIHAAMPERPCDAADWHTQRT